MSEVASLWASLGLDTAKFNEGIAKANASLSAFEKSAKNISRGFKKFGKDLDSVGSSMTSNLTVPILAAGTAIAAAAYATAKFGGEINDMAVRTGFSRESLQELKFAADQTGVSMESIEGATRKLTKSMGEAATGEGKAADLFKQLGIEVKNADGSLRPANEVFGETLEALKRIPDETTRNVVGMQLLGKSAGDLNPLIAEGKDGLNKFAKEARAAGLVMSEDAVIAADEFGDKMDKLKAQFAHAGMEIGTAFMPLILEFADFVSTRVIPAIKQFSEWFSSLSSTQKKWIVIGAAVVAGLGPLIIGVGSVVTALGSIVAIAPAVAASWGAILWPITLVVAGLAIIAAEWYAAISLMKSSAGSVQGFFDWVKGIFENLINYAKSAGTVLKGVFTFDMGTINKGVSDFNAAIKIGAANTLEAHKQAGILIEKYNGQRDASLSAAAATRKHIDEMRASKQPEEEKIIRLGEYKSKLDALVPALDNVQKAGDDILIVPKIATEPIITGGLIVEGAVTQMDYSVKTLSQTIEENEASLTKWAEVAKEVGQIGTQMAVDVFNGIGEAIGGIISGSQTAGEAMKNLFIGVFNNLKRIGSALIATGVPMLLAVATAPEGAKMIAAGTGIVAAGTAGAAIVHGFADGGLVFGETMGLVGEGRGTTRSNPEVIAPLDKLMGFLGGAGESNTNNKVEFIIQGETLRGVLQKNNASRRYLGNG